MVRGILFFLWLVSSWVSLAADGAAKTLPDGCPDLSGTYFCDGWRTTTKDKLVATFISLSASPTPTPHRNATIYKMTRYKPSEEVGKAGWGALVADGKNG